MPRKRSVGIAVRRGWIGWTALEQGIKRIQGYFAERNRALAAVLFLGGFRVSEVVGIPGVVSGLREDQVRVVDDFIVLENVHVLKKWRYTDAYDEEGRRVRERVEEVTTRAFPVDEPVVPYFMDWVWRVRRAGYTGAELFPISRKQAWRVIRKYTGWWPHFFRAERAIQLVVEYGWSDAQLRSFFKWTNVKTISTYASLGASEIVKAFPPDRTGRWRW
jgi:hypothetical protein